jgi:hypothetical protein
VCEFASAFPTKRRPSGPVEPKTSIFLGSMMYDVRYEVFLVEPINEETMGDIWG